MNINSEKHREKEEEAVALVIIVLFLGWLVYIGIHSNSFSNESVETIPLVENSKNNLPRAEPIIEDSLTLEFRIGDMVLCSEPPQTWIWKGEIVSIDEQLFGVQIHSIYADSTLENKIPPGHCTGNIPLIQADTGKIIEVSADCIQKEQ